jgi:hypothetical protein
MAEPMIPKAWRMPCIWSTLTKASSVDIFIAFCPFRYAQPKCPLTQTGDSHSLEALHGSLKRQVRLGKREPSGLADGWAGVPALIRPAGVGAKINFHNPRHEGDL